MDEARIDQGGALITADDFAALPGGERTSFRALLLCPVCGADAYFIREARNGRRACFGARPHQEGCELASIVTENGGYAALDETDERINAGDEFRLEPNRLRTIRHVAHDPSGSPGTGSAVRYVGRGPSRARVSSMSLDRLLRQLATQPTFSKSKTILVLPDDSRGRVKTVCRHVGGLSDRDANKRRIYWGTIRFPKSIDGGGAWLNTGSRATPSVLIKGDHLESVLISKHIPELDDLSGAFFAFYGYLRQGPSGKLVIFADEADWLSIRPYEEDAELN
jgi:hypothetical protein